MDPHKRLIRKINSDSKEGYYSLWELFIFYLTKIHPSKSNSMQLHFNFRICLLTDKSLYEIFH